MIRKIAHLSSLVLVLVLLAGCTVGKRYQRPQVATPPEFRSAPAGASDAASLADEKWFQVFKDPQLQELVRKALVSNYDLREAVARVEAARAQLGITRADQLPTVYGSAGVTTQRFSRNGSFTVPQNADTTRTFGSVGLNLLSFELDVWGRLRMATEAARAQLLSTEETQKAVVTTLVADVATAYFQLLELDSELEIAKRTLASRENSLELIRSREKVGVASTLDVRQAEQLVQVAGEAIPEIEQNIAQTENLLRLLTGESPGPVKRTLALTQQEQPPSLPAGLPSDLLARRPDIRAAEQNLISSNALIGVARAAYFPQISLTGLLGFQSNQLSSLFTGANKTWQFTPQVAQPIFTGGRLRSNVKFAEAQQKLALVQYERTIQTAFREVSDSLIQYEKVRDVRGRQEALVGTLQDRSRLSYVRYRGGVDTLLNALDADRDLFDAELRLAQLRRNELVTIVQLYRALGGGWQ
ncbi:MAG TPA: efflux transporter outer membrane subunit [Terriglobales bacterium]|nr:efflux transporter outer membrane subunit [Terriglobales bacterium]